MSGYVPFYLTCLLYLASISAGDVYRYGSTTKCDEFGNKLPDREGLHCETECAKPLTCVNDTGDYWTHVSPPVCRCLPPYKKDGLFEKCYKDIKCADDETLEDYECVKRCSTDAYRSNGKCLKLAALGQSCLEREQCKAAYADCVNGTCECLPGFSAIDEKTCQDHTQHQGFYCPFGEPLRGDGDKLVACGDQIGVKCPIGFSCFVDDADTSIKNITGGYCCALMSSENPKFKVRKCLVGQPHPNATCHSAHKPSEPGQTRCPKKTHECLRITTEGPCCPRACPEDGRLVNGQCIRLRSLDESCQVDEECATGLHGGFACKQGRCACADGYAPVFGSLGTSCQIQCGEDEQRVPHANTCIKSKKLGESCNPDDDHYVTGCRDSECSPQTRTCTCQCTDIPFDEYSCIPKPYCKRVPWRETNFTFCRTKDTNMSTEGKNDRVVDKCPEDSYCAKHESISPFGIGNLQTVGVCCSKTEPICPDNSKGITKCDPSKTDSCGKGMQCHRHTDDLSVDSDPIEFHVCCPLPGFKPTA